LEALKRSLIYLEKAVILLLFLVALKLLLSATDHFWHHGYVIPPIISLALVLTTLTISIIASLIAAKWQKKPHH